MIWELQLALFGLMIVSAFVALELREMLTSIAALGFYSFFAATLLVLMGAVDVAFTEAALGAGVIGVLLIAGVFGVSRRTVD